jgi:esterase/lipase
LFIHSKNDPTIPYKEVLALYNSYIQDKRELWSFNKPGHIHILYGSEEKSRSEIVDYFSQALTNDKSEARNH